MTYDIVFFDVDGTLTNNQTGCIPESSKKSIHTLLNQGTRVVAATGRPLSMCEELKKLGITTFITANGGLVTHQNDVIYSQCMNVKTVQAIENFARQHQHALSFYSHTFHMNGFQNEKITQALQETLSLATNPPIRQKDTLLPVHLLCLFGDERIEQLYKTAFPLLQFKRWHPYILNVLETDISKARAIESVLHYFHLDRSRAIAFGDGDNDIEMLSYVSVGVAMENGSHGIKQVANYITKSSSENGIEHALKYFSLIPS